MVIITSLNPKVLRIGLRVFYIHNTRKMFGEITQKNNQAICVCWDNDHLTNCDYKHFTGTYVALKHLLRRRAKCL